MIMIGVHPPYRRTGQQDGRWLPARRWLMVDWTETRPAA